MGAVAREDSLRIYETNDKRAHMRLLLLADEQENMIERYLDDGVMYVLDDGGVKAEAVVTDAGDGVLEIKSLATLPEFRGRGYGRALIEHICAEHRGAYRIVQVGTGDSPLTVPFYEKCGFLRSHVVKNFFTDNYDHPIVECGVTLKDMIYLVRRL